MAAPASSSDTAQSPDTALFTNFLVKSGKALVSVLETSIVAPAEAEAQRIRDEVAAAAEAQEASIAPWQTLAEQYSILEDELKVRILKIATSEANFTPQVAAAGRRRPGNILPGCLPMANAALAEDEALRALRFKLVPAALSEEDFFRCYFWHVANVKCEMLHDWRTANGARRAAAMEDEATLALADGEGAEAQPANAEQDTSAADDDLDLDAEFERLVSSPSPPAK